jgi:hypothetical protein
VTCSIAPVATQEQPPLVGGGADHEVNIRAGSGNNAITGCQSIMLAITPALWVGMRGQIGLHLRLRDKQAIDGDRCDRLSGCIDAEFPGEVLADPLRGRGRDHLMSRSTLGDGSPEQTIGTGHGKQRADAHTSSRLAKNGDAQIEEAIGADTVIDGHTYDAVAGEATAVIRRIRSELKGTARNPHHDRLPGRSEVGGPEIEAARCR